MRVNAWITTPTPRPRHAQPPAPRRDAIPAPATTSDDATPGARNDGPDRMGRLTARQLQVVALLADGHRYRAIAACLSISPNHVERHVRNAIERLAVHSPAELVAVAIAEGMLPTPQPATTAGLDNTAASTTAGRVGQLTAGLPA